MRSPADEEIGNRTVVENLKGGGVPSKSGRGCASGEPVSERGRRI
jgi:hypothetical protein